MLYAVLICTDEACAEEFEAWGELEDFDDMVCEGCGCTLQPLLFDLLVALSLLGLELRQLVPRRLPFLAGAHRVVRHLIVLLCPG